MNAHPRSSRSRPAPLARVFALAGCLALLGGCSESKHSENAAPGATVTLRGSNTFGEELAPALIAAFKPKHGDVTFDAEFKGTTYGFGALLAGFADIAAASRPPSSNELALAADRGVTLKDTVLGSYAVAVVVNAKNNVDGLSPEQVRGIFTGAIQNWKEVGGADAAIRLFIRDQVSGTYLGFQEIAMEKQPYALTAKPLTSYQKIAEAVAQDEHAIGFASVQLAAQPGVKGLAISGSAPTVDNAKAGKYPYGRVLHLYTDKAKESAAARAFIDFVQSAPGQEILNRLGFVPHP